MSNQCHGITLKGKRCTKPVIPPALYCHLHAGQTAPRPSSPTPKPVSRARPVYTAADLPDVFAALSVYTDEAEVKRKLPSLPTVSYDEARRFVAEHPKYRSWDLTMIKNILQRLRDRGRF